MTRPSIPIKHYLAAAQLFKWATKDHYVMWFEGHAGRHRRTETVLPKLVQQGKLRAIHYKKKLVYAAPRIRVDEDIDLKVEHGLGCTEGLIRTCWSRMDGIILPERVFYGCGSIPDWGIQYPIGKLLLFEFSTQSDFEHSPRFRSKICAYRDHLGDIEKKFHGNAVLLFVVDIERERLMRFIEKMKAPYFFMDYQTFKAVPFGKQLTAPIYFWGGDGKTYPLKANGQLEFIKQILLDNKPDFPNLAYGEDEQLFDPGLTMGTLYIGQQGTGKTSSLARHLVEYFKATQIEPFLSWIGQARSPIRSYILFFKNRRIFERGWLRGLVYDELGNPDWVVPLPEFSRLYGSLEDQVQRVGTNLAKLAPELVSEAPVLGGLGIREIAPQIFRLLCAISNDQGETWQITEAKRMLVDSALLRQAVSKYGGNCPSAKWFLEKDFLNLKPDERELRSYALLALLGTIEPREIRARVGFNRPGWTPREAILNGLMVIVNGARLINQRNAQHYLFTQVYSLVMGEINKRIPADPKDKPVALVMDEVYSLLSIPGMAEEIGKLSPLYRSRKLELYIVLQALSQLAPILKQQIWSIGNVVSFAISNFDEAYMIAQQLFCYNPSTVKNPSKTALQQPVFEQDRGQYLEIANWIQRLKYRECIMRRYLSEKQRDTVVRLIHRTRELPNHALQETVTELKLRLLKERGVQVRDALEVINQRKISSSSQSPMQV